MKRSFTRLAFVVALWGSIPAGVIAQSNDLTVHGYLTQGYARSTDVPLYGISKSGTTDYRAMALQFRYAISGSDAVVFQFSHRRLGASAIQETEPDLGLDWGFYQGRWAGTSVRVGRVPMPRGLFNEVRDVGTLLPFFRASKAFYSEGVETVDGISISRNVDLGDTGFNLDASAYYGEFTTRLELASTTGIEVLDDRLYDAIGGHVQVNTPIAGLRVTADYLDTEYSDGSDLNLWTTSADLSRDRYFVRGEYETASTSDTDGNPSVDYIAYYGQAGVAITPKIWVNGQYEFNSIEYFGILPSPPLASPDFKWDNIEDIAAGLSYRFSPLLVLKGEYHWFDGYQLDEPTFPLDPSTGQGLPSRTTDYFIVSLSAAF